MSSKDIAEAMAYDQINPFGEERADLRAGVISSVIANVNRKAGSKSFTPQDFMPNFEPKPERTINDEILEAFNIGNTSKSGN